MTHLMLNVLGGLRVLMDDVPIQSFESDKVRALLAYLAVEANRSHRREKLIGLLWPDSPDDVARHNLSQALFNLRLVLGDHTARPPFLLITRDAIQFNRESDYSFDLDQFNVCVDLWKRNSAQDNEDFTILISRLEEMNKLYRGEFLQQFYIENSVEFEDWLLVQRETLHQSVIEALTCLTNEYSLHADIQGARRCALRQLELDPWREEAHCQLMRVLALDGQRSAALVQYDTCRRVLADKLGVEPSKQTRELYEQIRSGELNPKADLPFSAVGHKLPVSLTPFIGREHELAKLAVLIADTKCRCITLVGPGGIGKTRLALEAAEEHWNAFAHGAAFIPLASVASIEAVIPAIADAIGLTFYGPADPKMQLLHYLREKQMLLLVDNVEHLLVESSRRETIADLLVEILQGADQVKLLVTSREALNQQGDWPFEVNGLAFPEVGQDDGLKEYGAVALFVQRAQRANPGFQMNTDDKTGIARICRLVEGMPLAIELSATWVRILSPAEIATEIEHSLDFLEASMRDLPERHRSMRAVFDHSWKILSSDEKGVLGKLSVFRGGFQRPAAEQVAGASLPVLSSLVIRSLLRRTATGRYELHELIRQFAALKLAEDPHEMHAVQEQHSLYYLGLLEGKDIDLKSKYQKEALVELTGEIDNLRAAWDWSTTNQNFIRLYRVSSTFAYLLGLRNWFKEGEVIFQKTANALRASNPRSEADAMQQVVLNTMLAHCGYFKFRLGRAEEAYTILAPSVDFLRKRDDLPSDNYFLWYLGVVYWELGRFSEAMECALENQILTRKSGERWHEALAFMLLGYVTHEQGAYKQASQYLSEAVAIMRQLGDPSMTAHFLSYLGRSLQALGEFSEAEKVLREGLELSRDIGYRFGMGLALHALGQVAYARENYAEARALFSECASLFQEIGDPHRLSLALNRQGLNSLALNQDAEAQSAFHAALRMAYEGGLMPSVLDALTGMAMVKTRQEASEGTLELVIWILEHSAITQETKNRAAQLREELEAKLSHGKIEAAQQPARSKSLDEVVHQILDST